MVVSQFLGKIGLSLALAAASLLSANPALANSSSNADIAAPLRAAQDAGQAAIAGAGEAEFRRLFSTWQDLDAPQPLTSTAAIDNPVPVRRAIAAVSIPSRMPVTGVRLTSNFGMRVHPVLGGRRAHRGIDLAAPVGTPIYATADGTVSKAEWFSSYGLYISLEHGGDLQTRYGHMSRLNVYAGQQVKKGDVIGYVGTTGRSTGPHLHYEVRIAGQAVNPVPYMQGDELARNVDANSTLTGQGGPAR